jgi:hypothetical protein
VFKKRAIQLSRLIPSSAPKSNDSKQQYVGLGIVGITRKSYKINQIVVIGYRNGTILNKKIYVIAKCIFRDKQQYNFEIINDGL